MAQRICSIDGCERPFQARDLCHTHYVSMRRNGGEMLDRSHLHILTDVDRERRVATCQVCGPETPVVALNRTPLCAIKSRERNAKRYKKPEGLEYQRRYQRVWKFNLEQGALEELLASQGGRCAICCVTIDERTARIDHDHACCPVKIGGRASCGSCVRGLLCNMCNSMLPIVEDPKRHARALEYLAAPKLVLWQLPPRAA